jgi:putative endonuclease
LGTNIRIGHLELDIVASLGPVAVVVEVRTRGERSWTSGLGSVTWAKRRRVRRAGEALWRSLSLRHPGLERMRFDLATVHWEGNVVHVEHVPAAF